MGFLTEAFYRMLGTDYARSSLAYVGYTAARPSAYTCKVVIQRKRVRYHCSRNGGRWK